MADLFSFDADIEEEPFEDEPETGKSAKSMPLILAALDMNEFSYYDLFGSTPEERAKNWTGESYPAMRWMSCVGKSEVNWAEARAQGRKKGDKKGPWPSTLVDVDVTPFYLIATNEIANKNFWDLGNHKKLQFLLLACVGQGSLSKDIVHNWIPLPKTRKAKNLLEELLYKMYPNINSLEIKILLKKYSDTTSVRVLCRKMGMNEEETKKILDSIK